MTEERAWDSNRPHTATVARMTTLCSLSANLECSCSLVYSWKALEVNCVQTDSAGHLRTARFMWDIAALLRSNRDELNCSQSLSAMSLYLELGGLFSCSHRFRAESLSIWGQRDVMSHTAPAAIQTHNTASCFVWEWNSSLAVKQEHKLTVVFSKTLLRISGPKRDEITAGGGKMYNENIIICTIHIL
jgi:hypothetical protein